MGLRYCSVQQHLRKVKQRAQAGALGFKPVRDAAGKPVPNGPVQAVLFTSFIIQ